MKKLTLVCALATASVLGFAQKGGGEGAAFEKGQNTVAIGYGVGNIWKTAFKALTGFGGGGTTKGVGPFAVTYENGVSDKVSVGVIVSFSSLKNEYTDKSKESLSQFGAVVRGNYHFGSSEKFDPYIGLGIGYYKFKFSATDPSGNNDPSVIYAVPGAVGFAGQLGAKYYFSPNVGLFAELGYVSGSYGQVGVNFKF